MRRIPAIALAIAVACVAAPVRAQDDRVVPIPVPSQPNAIVLGTGTLPG